MGKSDNVILTDVVPAFGALVSLLMYASPMTAVLNAAKLKLLGDLNPVPFVVTVANTLVWCTYGLVQHDPYVTAPNAPGIVVALFCSLMCFELADDKLRAKMRLLLCTEAGILALLAVLTAFATQTQEQRVGIWGVAGNVISLVYYAAPLSTMAEVIRTRNSASILPALTFMNTANAALWTVYGLAMADVYIWLPNGIGLVLSLCQLVLRALFPSQPKAKQTPANTPPGHDSPYARLAHPGDEEARLPLGDSSASIRPSQGGSPFR